jgi:hypothetical protein
MRYALGGEDGVEKNKKAWHPKQGSQAFLFWFKTLNPYKEQVV